MRICAVFVKWSSCYSESPSTVGSISSFYFDLRIYGLNRRWSEIPDTMVAYSEYPARYSMECYGRTSAHLFQWMGGPAYIADSTGAWGPPPYTLEEPPSPLMALLTGGKY
ncbi:hypothetical protein Pcinc_018787 [Petrolisthes cinctipes]|uniref:Uncharacterized protein n=1 Tax=Petrolisthes cinctipes TaxID=88211 RepID=A0AAE1KMC7_PETCI|nr:hypothetical protein Pcinc_018787 [Petrolisthes cinctipes]